MENISLVPFSGVPRKDGHALLSERGCPSGIVELGHPHIV
jgi:hypothetical protein